MSPALALLELTPTARLPGLVAVSGASPPDSIEEQYVIRQVAKIGGIDYVYFRRFSDGRSSQPVALVIDNSDDHFNEFELAEVHRKVWLTGCSPLLYIGWQTRVDVLACSRGPDFWKHSSIQYEPADSIEIAAQVSLALNSKATRYSARRLSDGTFWDAPENSSLAESGETAQRQLIGAVVEADKDIQGHKFPILRRLLLLTVLIKYLEDRGVFPNGWFSQFYEGAESFFDLLHSASPEAIETLLATLEQKFNGDVFELPKSRDGLTTAQLQRFADLVEARTLGAQRYLWEQYSFRYIPVEVLSHLYQHFAQKGKGAVFTPPFLASLILDYALPYKHISGDERVLDPTCGSGVFLVGAFRRLVHFWQSKNGWKQPDVFTLKRILKDSIFGIELQEEAVHLTAFSLALAICDELQSNVIWEDLRFEKLVGSNLQIRDVSDWLSSLDTSDEKKFTVIVGNPPFLSKLSQTALQYRKRQRRRVKIPDNQMAYFLVEQAPALLRDKGRLCLIQPHGFLYNEKARPFQKQILSESQIETILDFTSIRKLFDGVDPKTIALVVKKSSPTADHRILHLTFRRTFSVKERIAFELDHYDRHLVSQSIVKDIPWIWRANLLGGGRLQHVAARLDVLPKLRDFVERKKWDYGEGFVLARSGKLQSAPWLTNRPFLPTSALSEDGLDESSIKTVEAEKFRSAYTEARYSAPLVLIKKVETLPCALWTQGFLAYRDSILGIHAPESETEQLIDFYDQFVLNHDTLRACCAIFGTRALTSKATSLLKRDIDVLPWPDSIRAWKLSWWETVLCKDVLDWAGDFIRLGQNSRLLKEKVNAARLSDYAEVFVRMLGSVYSNLRPAESEILDGLAFQAFCFGNRSELDLPSNWSEKLKDIAYNDYGDVLRTIRVLRFYERNTIVVIKPDRLRYWIQSTAVRDADETLLDLQNQGY